MSLFLVVAFATHASAGAAQDYSAMPSAQGTVYEMVESDPYGGAALRVEVPQTAQFRLLPAWGKRTATIDMAGQDKAMQASIDIRWQATPASPLPDFRRYWDIYFFVEGGSAPVMYGAQTYWFDLDWNAYPSGQETFIRATHDFTLPHSAYDPQNDVNVEISQWVFVENRTIQLYDGGATFSGSFDVDNVTLRAMPNGVERVANGTFSNGVTNWQHISTPASTLSKLTLPAAAPEFAAAQGYSALPAAHGTAYQTVNGDPFGGEALRVEVPQTAQFRLLPAWHKRTTTIDMARHDKAMQAAIDIRWLQTPARPLEDFRRYWDIYFSIEGESEPVNLGGQQYWFDLDWSAYPAGQETFVRAAHDFVLPHLAYDADNSRYVEISQWVFVENRTIQLYDRGVTFSGAFDVDNVTLREVVDGVEHIENGTFTEGITSWQHISTPASSFAEVALPATPPDNAAAQGYTAVPAAQGTDYESIYSDPYGGTALRVEVPQTSQFRLLPTWAERTRTIDMTGQNKVMQASIDLRWQETPANALANFRRYWDIHFYVEGNPNPVNGGGQQYWFDLDWSAYPIGQDTFVRAAHNFTLPHMAYDADSSRYVEITRWVFVENRTIQLYDNGATFSGAFDVDNVTLREVSSGVELVNNGTFSAGTTAWQHISTPESTLSEVSLAAIPPIYAEAPIDPQGTQYSMVAPDPLGGSALRIDVPETNQVRLLPNTPSKRSLIVAMDGQDRLVHANIDVRWPSMATNVPAYFQRYWDVKYHVAGNSTPVGAMSYWFELDWDQFQQSTNDFVRAEHSFSLPHQVYNHATGTFEEISHWEFLENRTVQLYDASNPFNGTFDVDNVTFQEASGAELIYNGGFEDATTGWGYLGQPAGTLSLVTWDEAPPNYDKPEIVPQSTTYATVEVDSSGGFAMRMTVPETNQVRLLPTHGRRERSISMNGADKTIEASIDLRWPELPANPPGTYRQYWDVSFQVAGDPEGAGLGEIQYWYDLDWNQYTEGSTDFTRATHTFDLPHLVYNRAIDAYEEIERWIFTENRTLQLYDAQTTFAGTIDVDNASFRELQGGHSLVENGEIVGTIAGWQYQGSPSGSLELVPFLREKPPVSIDAQTLVATLAESASTQHALVVPASEGGYCALIDFQDSTQMRLLPANSTRLFTVSTEDGDQTIQASIDFRWDKSLTTTPAVFQRYWDMLAYVQGVPEPVVFQYAYDLHSVHDASPSGLNFIRATHQVTLPSQVTVGGITHAVTHWSFEENRSIQVYDSGNPVTGTLCVDNISFSDSSGRELNFNGDMAASTGNWIVTGGTMKLQPLDASAPDPLGAMKPNMRVVLDEPRIITDQFVLNSNRLVGWLSDLRDPTTGAAETPFSRMDTTELVPWMRARVTQGDAYGSVLVIPAGWTPQPLVANGPLGRALWFEYIKAGGRIVYVGGVPLLVDTLSGAASTLSEFQAVRSRFDPLLATAEQWGSTGGYWAGGTTQSVASPAAAEWGFENPLGPSNRGLRVDALVGGNSTPFSLHSQGNRALQAADGWFRNVSPNMPWSGMVRILQSANFASDSHLSDVYRAANYMGSSITVPAMPAPIVSVPPPSITVTTESSGIDNRREFVQGETFDIFVSQSIPEAASITVSLTAPDANEPVWTSGVQPVTNSSTGLPVMTAELAPGEYDLVATVLDSEESVLESSIPQTVGVRVIVDSGFYFESFFGTDHYSPDRVLAEAALLPLAGMGVHLRGGKRMPETFDAIVRSGKPFSVSVWPNLRAGLPTSTSDGSDPLKSYYRLNPDDSQATLGQTPNLGIAHVALDPSNHGPAVMQSVVEAISQVAAIPSFSDVALCNDDYTLHYGWDYQDRVVDAFKSRYPAETDAPKSAPSPTEGEVPDDELWSRWWRFHLTDVVQAFNAIEMDEARLVNPDIKMGPIPGPMGHPHIAMFNQPTLYPYYNYGGEGFNLISSYYYSGYYEPPTLATYWMDIGRMGNRSLPQWITPEMTRSAALLRSRLFHFLAGGVHGMSYFLWNERTQASWDELSTQSEVIAAVGPTQATLAPARRRVGLLHSFTTNVFDSEHARHTGYAYINLMQAGYDVEPVAEEEIVDGRGPLYDVIALHKVEYLPASVMDALVAFAQGPGTLLLDSTVPFDISGAVRVSLSLGDAYDGAGSAMTYGRPARIAAIRDALRPHLEPMFESRNGQTPDFTVVATNFETGAGGKYTWFVDTPSNDELLAGNLLETTHSGQNQVQVWEQSTFSSSRSVTVSFPSDPGNAYDLTDGGAPLAVTQNGNRYDVQIGMQRLGGRLIAWTPHPLTALTVKAPAVAYRSQYGVTFAASLWMGRAPAPDGLPIDFVLLDPDGKRHPLSQRMVTKHGLATLRWRPASNAQEGTWTVKISDGAAGFSDTVRVRVKARPPRPHT